MGGGYVDVTICQSFWDLYLRCIHFLDVNHTSMHYLREIVVQSSGAVKIVCSGTGFGLKPGSNTNYLCDFRQEIGLYTSVFSLVRSGWKDQMLWGLKKVI